MKNSLKGHPTVWIGIVVLIEIPKYPWSTFIGSVWETLQFQVLNLETPHLVILSKMGGSFWTTLPIHTVPLSPLKPSSKSVILIAWMTAPTTDARPRGVQY